MSMQEVSSHVTKVTKFPTPKSLIKKYGLKPRKSLGQNFLCSISLAERIVELAELPQDSTIVELGIGLGTLTFALTKKAKKVIGFELDKRLLEILQAEAFLPENVELRHGDILHLDYQGLYHEISTPLILFGNLPYYLSSRLVYKLLEQRKILDFAVFMFQKEVCLRFTAKPGSKDYGQLSVLLGLMSEVTWLITLSPAHFYPKPEVDSAVLKIKFKRERLAYEDVLFQVVKASFSNRRKKLARNLTSLGLSFNEAKDVLKEVGLSPDIRAEAVPKEAFLALTETIASKVKQFQNTLSFSY